MYEEQQMHGVWKVLIFLMFLYDLSLKKRGIKLHKKIILHQINTIITIQKMNTMLIRSQTGWSSLKCYLIYKRLTNNNKYYSDIKLIQKIYLY